MPFQWTITTSNNCRSLNVFAVFSPSAADTGSRQIFQLQRRSPTHPTAPSGKRVQLRLPASDGGHRETLTGKQEPSSSDLTSESKRALSPLPVVQETDDATVHKDESREELQVRPRAETERLPRALLQQRRVRSATVRPLRPTEIPTLFPRPKTVGGSTRGIRLLPMASTADLEGLCDCIIVFQPLILHILYTICILLCALLVYYICILLCTACILLYTLLVYCLVYYCKHCLYTRLPICILTVCTACILCRILLQALLVYYVVYYTIDVLLVCY